MGILQTGRQNMAQADFANRQATGLANELQANKAGREIAEKNAKSTARGQALGGMATMALSQAPSAAAPSAGLSAANAGMAGSSSQLGLAGGTALNNSLTAGSMGLSNAGAATGATTAATAGSGAGITGASTAAAGQAAMASGTTAAAETAGSLAASQAASTAASTTAASGAAAGAGAGASAMAAIPYIGWAAAAGMLAYSLFS